MDDVGVVWMYWQYGNPKKDMIESTTERSAQLYAEQWLEDKNTVIYFFADLGVD